MFSRQIAVLALLVIPTVSSAQRRTRGEVKADWDKIGESSTAGPKFSNKDVENLSAVKIIVDKRKDLKLSDDQTKQFKELGKKEEARNQGLFTTLDSLRVAMKPRVGVSPEEERPRTTIARQEAMRVISEIRANYDSTFKEALPLLDETQQKAATELVQKERDEAEGNLSEKLTGGRAVQSSSGSRRRRPATD